jgi:hypothetical protein
VVYVVEEVKESGETWEKLRNIYCSPYIVTVILLMSMTWTWYVGHTENEKCSILWLERLKGNDCLGYLGMLGLIMLK